MGTEKIFDRSKFSVVVLTPAPIDITDGLIQEGDLFESTKETKEESQTRKGLNNESYTTMFSEDKTRELVLRYLPASTAVTTLRALRDNKSVFGIIVKNDSAPKYMLTASNCMIKEDPGTKVNGKSGFADNEFKIRAVDADEKYL